MDSHIGQNRWYSRLTLRQVLRQTGGVKVADVIESQAPDKLVYEPGNPLADAKGYVKMPNVDVVGEMVNTMSASRSYQANVEVLNTVKSMMLKTLTLGQ